MGQRKVEHSLLPVSQRLHELIGLPVHFVSDCIGADVLPAIQNSDLVVLENLRFYAEEEKNDKAFAQKLAAPFDLFIMDAFSAAHRAHASTKAVADCLPSLAGPLLVREILALSQVRDHPQPPFALVLGGAKVSDKIGVIENLLDKVSSIIVGGGMAFTFLQAQGFSIGRSLCERDKLDFAKAMIEKAERKGVALLLPEDVVVAAEISTQTQHRVVSIDEIPADAMGLDIGPVTASRYREHLKLARTVLWNGPMGVFELEPFAEGTRRLCESMEHITAQGGFTLIGGGDTAAAINRLGFGDKVSHVSTGGGASLEFFEGKMLPGVEPYVIE
jgi:phosphoglycerate kinase